MRAFGITPWNPPTGLSFALILLFGVEFLPWLFVAPVLADGLVRGFALPLPAEIAASAHHRRRLCGGHGAAADAAAALRRDADDAALAAHADDGGGRQHRRWWQESTSLMLVAFGLLPAADFGSAALRFWVGDMIGVAVLTPFLLVLMTRRRLLQPSWEAAALLVLVVAAMFAVFGFAGAFRFQLFYLFFLPVIWTAVRFGLEGVTVGLLLTQIGLIAAIHFTEDAAADVTAYQALMVVLTLTGLAVGVLVSEQQRTQQQLRINQEALDRAFRLGSMGEFAAALAHEINQPLTAVANYARVARNAPNSRRPRKPPSGSSPRWSARPRSCGGCAISFAWAVAKRAWRMSETWSMPPSPIAERSSTGRAWRCRCASRAICRPVSVDAVQIEQVLVNLVRNSAEALGDAGRHDGRIVVTGARDGKSVAIEVRDNGPGFDPGIAERAAAPFTTTKPEGLGLGLSLARSIIEAHGGTLSIESNSFGAVVSFTLPSAAADKDSA